MPSRSAQQVRPVVFVTGARRVLYRVLGWGSVGMAVVGAILPGIPTAPFVILAGYFFIRSSPARPAWLEQSRWFGPILSNWEEQHAVSRTVKYLALGLIGTGMAFTLLLGLPVPLTAAIITFQVIGVVIVLSLQVAGPKSDTLAAAIPETAPRTKRPTRAIRAIPYRLPRRPDYILMMASENLTNIRHGAVARVGPGLRKSYLACSVPPP